MTKYAPLTDYLFKEAGREIRLSFAEIERIIGSPLPPSKKYPAWWSNNPTNSVMTKAWLAAGYRSEQVDVSGEKVTFRRDGDESDPIPRGRKLARSPLFGSMKGTTIVMPGVDLTAPMDLGDWDPDVFKADDVIVGEEIEKIKRDPGLNISDRIRALDKLGMPRAEIARELGKRYQHVRNVLEAGKSKAA
jgi:hypothetical protein